MKNDQLLKVVLAQIDVIFGKPEENFNHIKHKLQDIKSTEQYNLIVLPELFATGYDLQAIKKNAQSLEKSKIVQFLKSLATEKHCFVYSSVPELANDKIFNTAVFIDPTGHIIGSYRKIHLFRPLDEHIAFAPGNTVSTISTDLGLIGLSVCYDLRFAELYVKQRNNGAKIFLICAEWPIPRIKHWTTLIQARAIEHQSLIIALNRVGEDPTGLYGGNSLIVAPDGEILSQADEHETILTCTINLKDKIEMPFLFNIKNEKQLI